MHQSIPSANTPRGKKHPRPGICSQPFLLIGVEVLEFCRNQRIERLSNNFLVIPSSFSLSTILYHSKVLIDNILNGRWATPDNSDGTNPGTRAESRCKTPGMPREMLALEIN